MEKVVVTGGAGFIGSNLAAALAEKGYDVTVVDNLSTGKASNLSTQKIKLVKADINNTELLRKTFKGTKCIFHQAALPSVPRSIEKPQDSHYANATGTLSVLVAARDAKVCRVVYASSSSVYGDEPTLPKREDICPKPLSPYAASKLLGEIYCRQFCTLYGLETVSLRYFNVFGPHQDPASQYAAVIPKFITTMMKGKQPTIFGDGKQSRDFTYVQNVVYANILAMTAKKAVGEIINIACGERITLLQLADELNKILKTSIQPVHAPLRAGDIPHSWADVSKAKQLLGFKPVVTFSEGLKNTVEWLSKQVNK